MNPIVHFEIIGERHKNNDNDSEEEIWIPVKPKKIIRYNHFHENGINKFKYESIYRISFFVGFSIFVL